MHTDEAMDRDMTRLMHNLRLATLIAVLMSCFSGVIYIPLLVVPRAYVLLVYGPTAARQQNLHVVDLRYGLAVSNGDRSPWTHQLGCWATIVVLGAALAFLLMGLLACTTWLLGRRVFLGREIDLLMPKEVRHWGDPPKNWLAALAGGVGFLLGCSIGFFLIARPSVWQTLAHLAIFLVAATGLLRAMFGRTPSQAL
jgi:hypothetical protein